ncbi:MAG: hypothetical protein JWO50_515 [Candidatus Kaiserbacteria bacterium]|nr:hypothetical protein [Candidatus Kaiserbacteria bacterium]
MKNFFFGIACGIIIEALSALPVYRFVQSFYSNYVDPAPYLLEYPAIILIFIGIYLLLKKQYIILGGMIAGFIGSLLILAFLLSGA